MSHSITHHLQDGLHAQEAQGMTEGPSSDSRLSAATCGFPENGVLVPGRGWGMFPDWTGMAHKELLLVLSFIHFFIHSLTHSSIKRVKTALGNHRTLVFQAGVSCGLGSMQTDQAKK